MHVNYLWQSLLSLGHIAQYFHPGCAFDFTCFYASLAWPSLGDLLFGFDSLEDKCPTLQPKTQAR